MNLYRRIAAYYRPHTGGIALALTLMVAAVALNVLKPWPVKYVIDRVLSRHAAAAVGDLDFNTALLLSVAALLVIHVAWGALNMLANYRFIEIGLRALLRLRTELYACLQSLPLRYHDNKKSGDSLYRVAYDSQSVQTFFNQGFATVAGSALTLLVMFAVMFNLSVKLSLLALAVTPFLLLTISAFAARIRRETARWQQDESDVLSRATEGLNTIRVVHAFGREDYEVGRFEEDCRRSMNANRRLMRTSVVSTMAVGLVTALGLALLLYFGACEVAAARLAVGDLWIFLSYLTMLYQPLEQLSYTAWSLEGAAAGAQRVFEVLDAENDTPDLPRAGRLAVSGGQIEFRGVTFGYTPAHPILRDLSLTVTPGQTVAIVGGTGAGKTTVLSLLTRFYDPAAGRILIDGQDIKTVTKQSLRGQISMVLQDTLLLNSSVAENIAYGRPAATMAQVTAAARAAQADDFIRQLPQGYHTEVGERGVKLSGGQRQRIAIARAFLRNSPLLLLDEPTSALDLATEAALMVTLKTLMQRSTTLIVTHRLATIHDVDCIYVMEHGQVVETGTGPALLAQHGVYARLWHSAGDQPALPKR
ncbi:MAG: ABC transporter ATP-binding protein/permease [Verrucomicrobiales bacterium]|jgi:ATP-binding cassette subfamily B protein/subfamily B ATP-binding cassette protein MsbA|nr:ABC transporter ATP-binding protein/permease [Verrucomicrobiales bacterium]